jgi:LysR family transcriptional regulator, hydrogen peroxide-inducible genes activator
VAFAHNGQRVIVPLLLDVKRSCIFIEVNSSIDQVYGRLFRMNLRDLRYLVAVADHLHFGKAAAACNVSQPTLSTQLKKLEAYLGTALLERTNKSVHLTATGAEVVARARRVLAEADGIIAATRRRKGPLVGPLQLGIIPTLGPYLLPWLVPAARKAYPELRLVVQEDLTARLLDQLQHHRLDAAMMALPAAGEGWETAPLFDEPFWLACPKDHPLAHRARVSEAELDGQHLLVLAEGHCLRDQALAVCGGAAAEAESGVDFRATSLETLRQMVASGMGCTLLPALALGPARHKTMVQRPVAGGVSRRVGLVWRRSDPKAGDFPALAQLVRQALPQGVRAVR